MRKNNRAMLIALSGLPGAGKTTIARLLADRLPAVHVRIDTIEQALLRAGWVEPLGAEAYVVGHGVASDNLQRGHCVIADCVNATQPSRDGWADVARSCQVPCLHVALVCGDAVEHRRRVAERTADIAGHVLPTWARVTALRWDPLAPGTLQIDTSACSADDAAATIARQLRASSPPHSGTR
jgi:predicted kinase